jgi:pimeloyl-ACP methyl ester carboxylesterase
VTRALIRIGTAAVLLYAAMVGFLAFRETALVYAGSGVGSSRRITPDSASELPWDTLRVSASDGVPVLLLRSRLDDSTHRPWAIFLHGNYGFIGARANVSRYQLLREAGFNVLAVEYRGYGASAGVGPPSERGVKADAAAGWTYLTRTLGVPPARVVVYGWSLGGGPATYLASEFKAAALITEGTFTTLPDVAASAYPWVPVRLVMRNKFDNAGRAPAVTMPWVIFHGRHDTTIPFTHGEALAAAAPRGRFVPLAADHDEGVMAQRALALAALRDVHRHTLGTSSR